MHNTCVSDDLAIVFTRLYHGPKEYWTLVTLYSVMKSGQHWFRQWPGTKPWLEPMLTDRNLICWKWFHRLCFKRPITKIYLKIKQSKSQSHLQSQTHLNGFAACELPAVMNEGGRASNIHKIHSLAANRYRWLWSFIGWWDIKADI